MINTSKLLKWLKERQQEAEQFEKTSAEKGVYEEAMVNRECRYAYTYLYNAITGDEDTDVADFVTGPKFDIGDRVKGISDVHSVANSNLEEAEVVAIDCSGDKELITLKMLKFKDSDQVIHSETFEMMASIFGEKGRKLKAGDLIGKLVRDVEAEDYERLR